MKTLLLGGLLFALVNGSTPTFKLCDDQGVGAFSVDLSNTFTTPADVEKGNHEVLTVNGIMLNDVTLSLLELDVTWAGTFL